MSTHSKGPFKIAIQSNTLRSADDKLVLDLNNVRIGDGFLFAASPSMEEFLEQLRNRFLISKAGAPERILSEADFCKMQELLAKANGAWK